MSVNPEWNVKLNRVIETDWNDLKRQNGGVEKTPTNEAFWKYANESV